MHRLLILAGLWLCASAMPRNDLYPYGEEHGDRKLATGDDVSSGLRLQVPAAFYGDVYDSIYVNLNGLLSFRTPVSSYDRSMRMPFDHPVIAPFFADADTRASGNVYYRETLDAELLTRAAEKIWRAFPNKRSFEPISLFIVTWDEVGYYDQQSDAVNTFQVIIASDGDNSFVFLHYPDDGLNWSQGQGKADEEDLQAQAGFDSGDGRSRLLPASATTSVRNLYGWSNIRERGVWIFRVGNVGSGEVLSPGEEEEEEEEPEAENPTSCAEGGERRCDSHAQCSDYQGGFCCHCNSPYFGNGYQCISAEDTHRLSGSFSGIVNNEVIEPVDLHAFIVSTDGRTYTSIGRFSESLGYAMQTLFPLGGVLGFLFAMPKSPQALNGFMASGGDFNLTATVRFLSGGQLLSIQQTGIGRDESGMMSLNTRVRGELPIIAAEADVSVDDLKQQYSRVSPGVIRSNAVHIYRVDGIPYRMQVELVFYFRECAANPLEGWDNMRVTSSRHFINYDNEEQIVRFVHINHVAKIVGRNPCESADQVCDRQAECVPLQDSYRCVCRDGYTGDGRSCSDIDECATNVHDCHQFAVCRNRVGGFDCACQPGYRGDGRDCVRERTCADLECDRNARCVYDPDTREPLCECNMGFTGDGLQCTQIEFSCNEVNNCHENAECEYLAETGRYECVCNEGYSGDGLSCTDTGEVSDCLRCDSNARCDYDVDRLMYRCQCLPEFTGDGYSCSPIAAPCNEINNCAYNARCVRDDEERTYKCVCNDGYQGDGLVCQEVTCEVADNCGDNARCLYDNRIPGYQCVCNPGYYGNGFRCLPEGCNVQNYCHSSAQCVYNENDRRYQCQCNEGYEGDGRACSLTVIPCNQLNNCDINGDCLQDPSTGGYVCRCKAGYEGDGYSCTLTGDCRRDPRVCDRNARCVPRGTDYVCACNPGYTGDGQTCTGMLAVGIDTDCHARNLYWTDVAKGTISKSKLDGSDVEVIQSGLQSPEGVAVDWVGKNIYWTDSEMDRIEASRADGTNRKTLISEGLVNPRAIVVDPRGLMFWADWNRGSPKIERSYLDGTSRQLILDDDLGLPNGLTIDFGTYNLCWSDAGTSRLECMNYEGRGRRVIYGEAEYPFGITYANNVYFWTDWHMKTMPNINQFSETPNEDLVLPPGGNGRLYGVTAVRTQCPRGSNACFLNNGGCRFLCLPTPNGGRTCECPDDIDQEECNRIGLLL